MTPLNMLEFLHYAITVSTSYGTETIFVNYICYNHSSRMQQIECYGLIGDSCTNIWLYEQLTRTYDLHRELALPEAVCINDVKQVL